MKTKINIEVLCELCHYLKKDQIELLLENLPIGKSNINERK